MKRKTCIALMLSGMLSMALPSLAQTEELVNNDVVETIMARRSVRKYTPRPVDNAKLYQILKCGINAPNGMYKQSWEVRVVRNKELLAKIDAGFAAEREKMGKPGKGKAFYGAPCLIFIAYDPTYDMSQVDCGLLGENIIISAQSMGLGTCCLGQLTRFITSEEAKELYDQLDFPDTHKLLYAISLGYPAEHPAAKARDMGKVKFID